LGDLHGVLLVLVLVLVTVLVLVMGFAVSAGWAAVARESEGWLRLL
jgi:hypothetical protein